MCRLINGGCGVVGFSAKIFLSAALLAGVAGAAWALDDKPTEVKPSEVKPEDVPQAVRDAQAKLEADRAAAAAAAATAQQAADDAKAAAAAAGAAPMELKTLNIEPAKPAPVPVPDMPVVATNTLDGGLIVEDLKIGDGAVVQEGGLVVAFYHGTLKADGKVFDSAFDRGEPIAFPLSGVIQGWQKGVPGMKVGGIRRLTIPYAMAYGEAGSPPAIPERADLVFVIQLVNAVSYEDVVVGTGEAANDMCVGITAMTVKNTSGEVVAKTEEGKPFILIPNDVQGIMGTDVRGRSIRGALAGMKVGGKRTIKLPAEFVVGNLSQGGAELAVPSGQDLVIDLELQAVRNLGGQ